VNWLDPDGLILEAGPFELVVPYGFYAGGSALMGSGMFMARFGLELTTAGIATGNPAACIGGGVITTVGFVKGALGGWMIYQGYKEHTREGRQDDFSLADEHERYLKGFKSVKDVDQIP
jgi:hypothetical protein